MKLAALIVDDEPLARESLRVLLARHEDIAVAGEASHGREALAMIRRRTPDLLFLDVQMPGMTGLEMLRRLGPLDSMAVIFVTAYDHFAIKAFESRALDYLLKPYTDDRFEQVLARAKRHIRDRTLANLGSRVLDLLEGPARRAVDPATSNEHAGVRTPGRDTLLIRHGRRTVLVRDSDIEWIEATDYYARVHAAGTSYLMRESLKSLEARLDSTLFVRLHRSALVNVTRIRELEKRPSGDAVAILMDGQRVRVSRHSSLLSRRLLQRYPIR